MQAAFQVDEVVLDVLNLAAQSRHGFRFSGEPAPPCKPHKNSATSVALQNTFLSLRAPPWTRGHLPSIFGEITSGFQNCDSIWNFLDLQFSSTTPDVFLCMIFDSKDLSKSPLVIELRDRIPWVVTGSYALELSQSKSRLQIAVGKFHLGDGNREVVILASVEETSGGIIYFIQSERMPFRRAFRDEVFQHLQRVDCVDEGPAFGRNVFLGGTNWATEAELGRDIVHVWSALGRQKNFDGCIKRWVHEV